MKKQIVALALGVLMALPVMAAEKSKIVFVAGRDSHGRGQHEHSAGIKVLSDALSKGMDSVEVALHHGGWPKDASIFDDAKAVVIYCDGGKRHVLNAHLEQFDVLAKKGVGLVCLHYGVETVKGEPGDKFLEWMGGYFETHWSVNPHWTAEFKELPDHPITSGVKPFSINDEWYFHMRFAEDMKGVTPILSAVAPKSTMKRGNGPHSGNPHVRKSVEAGDKQHLGWAFEREGEGRGFGFTGGHHHKNWGNKDFRTTVLNAIVWAAGVKVPKDGVPSESLTEAELMAVISEVKKK